MFNEHAFSLNPVQFFSLSCDCHYLPKNQLMTMKTHTLPSTQSLTQETTFAKLAMGWNEEGITFLIDVHSLFNRPRYPQLENGDSVELFIDTRDLKTAGFNTRFCHHFFFLPELVDEVNKGEITHFRTEDQHTLCDPELLQLEVERKKSHTFLTIFIPTSCLFGYDPKQFDRLGFTYRINRMHGEPQQFSVKSENYQIDQQPSLWASLKLINKEGTI